MLLLPSESVDGEDAEVEPTRNTQPADMAPLPVHSHEDAILDDSSSLGGLAADFHRAMVNVHKRAATEAGYNATLFIRMISELGGVETARKLAMSPTASQGFTELWERGRLDLTAEALMTDDRFSPLFSEEELAKARWRLAEHGQGT
jgi:hypothetical protein